MTALLTTNLGDIPLLGRGKVRDLYAVGDALLLVATDRISAFDHVLATGIPGKGKILTQISLFWFDLLSRPRSQPSDHGRCQPIPAALQPYADQLEGRSMLVQARSHVSRGVRGARLPGRLGMEGISGRGTVCGIPLARRLAGWFAPAGAAVHAGHQEPGRRAR